MPWSHCGHDRILDNHPCPGCNVTKDKFTTLFKKTRIFAVKVKPRVEFSVFETEPADPELKVSSDPAPSPQVNSELEPDKLDMVTDVDPEGTDLVTEVDEVQQPDTVCDIEPIRRPDVAASVDPSPAPDVVTEVEPEPVPDVHTEVEGEAPATVCEVDHASGPAITSSVEQDGLVGLSFVVEPPTCALTVHVEPPRVSVSVTVEQPPPLDA